jgi:cytochrome c553
MEPVAAGLGPEEMRRLARHYADLRRTSPPSSPPPSAEAADRTTGEAIARDGIADQRVPACAACHGPGGAPRHPVYPRLAGQYAEYLALQLPLFKGGLRGDTAYAPIMRMVTSRLTPEQMRAAALDYASLPADPPGDLAVLEDRAPRGRGRDRLPDSLERREPAMPAVAPASGRG